MTSIRPYEKITLVLTTLDTLHPSLSLHLQRPLSSSAHTPTRTSKISRPPTRTNSRSRSHLRRTHNRQRTPQHCYIKRHRRRRGGTRSRTKEPHRILLEWICRSTHRPSS